VIKAVIIDQWCAFSQKSSYVSCHLPTLLAYKLVMSGTARHNKRQQNTTFSRMFWKGVPFIFNSLHGERRGQHSSILVRIGTLGKCNGVPVGFSLAPMRTTIHGSIFLGALHFRASEKKVKPSSPSNSTKIEGRAAKMAAILRSFGGVLEENPWICILKLWVRARK
jgi:hypothetical protein